MSFQQSLAAQHRSCDAEFVKIEQAAERGDWALASGAAASFVAETQAHFLYEEEVLFPALQAAAPMTAGPVTVMCNEHLQMRELFADLIDATRDQDRRLLSDAVDTLLLLMQQHNHKEENILYPIADQVLSADILAQLEGHSGAA